MEKLLEILQGIRPDVDFVNEKSLIDDGILDSFDVVSIISELDDVFGNTGCTPSTSSMILPISSRVPNCPNLPIVSTPRTTSFIPSSSSIFLHLVNPSTTEGRAVSGDLPYDAACMTMRYAPRLWAARAVSMTHPILLSRVSWLSELKLMKYGA